MSEASTASAACVTPRQSQITWKTDNEGYINVETAALDRIVTAYQEPFKRVQECVEWSVLLQDCLCIQEDLKMSTVYALASHCPSDTLPCIGLMTEMLQALPIPQAHIPESRC